MNKYSFEILKSLGLTGMLILYWKYIALLLWKPKETIKNIKKVWKELKEEKNNEQPRV